jgi:hypothetical protein
MRVKPRTMFAPEWSKTMSESADEPEMMIAAQPPNNVAVAKVYTLTEKSI